jgi:outer membrane protein OmpA-like peptidoglycan-associated protein
MRILGSILLVLFGAGSARSQELTFSEPVKLGSNVNSEAEELSPLMSADGKTLYFSRAFYDGNTGGKFAGTDIWVSKKDEAGQWLPAVNMNNRWNNKLSNSVIGINQDHSVVYLLNAYSNKSGISFSKFYSGEWGVPEFIPIPGINRDDFVGFYANPKFDVILISMKGKDSFGEEDLYVSLKDSFGNWTEPKNLGATINTKGFEISPFLAEDKKRLFFSSNGHGGFGDADIFYCDRLFDSWETWSVPKNLGDKINSKSFDAYFSMYDSVGLLSSTRDDKSSSIFKVVISKKVSSVDAKVKEIIDEAQTILTDLSESAKNENSRSINIIYLPNSVDLDPVANAQITKAIEQIKRSKIKNVRLVAFSNEFNSEEQNNSISDTRIQKLVGILKSSLGSVVSVSSSKKKSSVKTPDRSYIEIIYE